MRSGDLHRRERVGEGRCGNGGVIDGGRGGAILGEIDGKLLILSVGCCTEQSGSAGVER